MTKLPAFLIAIMVCFNNQNAKAQSFTFTIASPAPSSISDSILNINVQYYTSTYELARITAVTEGLIDTLTNAGNAGGYVNFNGVIDIRSFTQGNTYKLKVTCRDVLGNEKTDSVNYIYINPPVAQIISPVSGTDIWPALHIQTSHTGFGNCTSKVTVEISSQTLFTYTSASNDIDTSIVLSNTLNGEGIVTLTVTDNRGNADTVYCSVTADKYHSYPYLTPVYTGGKILDYEYDKILEVKNRVFYIVDSGFQTSSAIPGYSIPSYYGTIIPIGSLTPYGAIWTGYEWTNGVLRTQSYSGYGGKYATYKAIWYDTTTWGATGYGLYRKDLGTGTSIEIDHNYNPPSQLNESVTVDPRGSVIYSNGDQTALFRYKVNGGSNLIATTFQPYVFGNVLLYGDTLLYSTYNAENPSVSTPVYINNGISNTVLTNTGSAPIIAGKYIAIYEPGTTGQNQIWLRDSTGNAVQITFFGTSSYIAGLNEYGDILFSNNSKYYYLKKDSVNPKEIGAPVGGPFYRNNTWYVIKSNTLYKINVNAYRTIAAGNWSNPATWQNGIVPPPGADVIVDTNITVDTDATCNTLRVILPASVTVAPGVNLTVLH